ncbi:MAG: glycosyltransferase [Flavobacteriaceae bacterium]|nr:glycosyltransferase [Flavobacteriaceae bacterium]
MNETICFFNSEIPWGGGEKWHFETAKFMHENGHKVMVICHKKSVLAKRLKLENIAHTKLNIGNLSFLNPLIILRLVVFFKKNKVDSVVLNLSRDVKVGGLAALIAKVKRKIYFKGSANSIRNSYSNRLLYRHIIDEILVNSKATKACVFENNPNLFDEDYVKVISHGIDFKKMELAPYKPVYKKTNEEIVLVSLGRLEIEKNHIFLIDVARKLKNDGIKFKLIIGGSGSLKNYLEEKVSRENLKDVVSFFDFIKNPKDIYESADVLLLPSLYEGFGYVIVEAAACKIPTIAFNNSSKPELIQDGKTGFLTPDNDVTAFSDVIQKFYSNRNLIKEMGENAYAFTKEKFSIERINLKLLKYLQYGFNKKITALITTYNEEKNIERCLKTVKWADEILVVDSFSTDNTVEICKQFGAKIIQREYNYAASQKNWAIPKAKYQWIFLLDADEEVDVIIEKELREILQSRPKNTAFWLKRKNYFLKQHIRFCGWQNDRVVRFFNRDYHRYEDKRVHAEILGSKQMGVLKTVIKHHTAQTLEAYIKKINRYAGYAAQELIKKDKKIGWVALYVKPAYKFLHNYIIRGGVLDGKNGWVICSLQAKELRLRALKAKQLNH